MPDPTARLIASTRRRLIVVTLSLVALLVLGIGAATAFVGLRALDADVDRALQVSVDTAVAALDGELPQAQESNESDETVPAAADTFLLYLDPNGTEIANPSGVVLTGLPDTEALGPAAANGSDLRTVQAGGVDVRLLTEPIPSSSGGPPIGYVQGGFVLTLHDQQSNSLVMAVVVVAVVGLIGAALVTLVVTGDALVPIRRSFAAQRRFVADASHELKTPPAIIRANAEVLEREALVTDEGRPLVADIVTETDRLSRLVGDLLQLASADATGLAIERERIDLGAVAADTVRQTQALAAEHEVALRIESPTPGADRRVWRSRSPDPAHPDPARQRHRPLAAGNGGRRLRATGRPPGRADRRGPRAGRPAVRARAGLRTIHPAARGTPRPGRRHGSRAGDRATHRRGPRRHDRGRRCARRGCALRRLAARRVRRAAIRLTTGVRDARPCPGAARRAADRPDG